MSLLTVKQNAKFWGFSESWIYRHWPELHGFKAGSRIKIDEEDQEKLREKLKDSQKRLTIPFFLNTLRAGGNKMATSKKGRLIHGLGSVYKRKKGKSWTIDFYKNGKRIQEVVAHALTKEEALFALQQEVAKAFDEKYGVERRRKIGFKDFARIYLDCAMVSKKSWKTDRSRLKVLNGYFENIELRAITPLKIEKLRASILKEGRTKSTTNRYMALLKRMFNIAIEEGHAEKNPVKKIRLYSEKDTLKERVLTEEEERRLIKNCAETLKPIITVALNTGMRKSEILNLKWSQVDLRAERIKVEKTKSGKVRFIPLNDGLFCELSRLRSENNQSPFVFFNPETRKPYVDMKKGFKTACRRSGIEGMRFHDLRHTFATRLRERGVDIEDVRDLLGHHSIIVTERYSHLNDERKRKAVKLLDKKADDKIQPGDIVVTGDEQSDLIH